MLSLPLLFLTSLLSIAEAQTKPISKNARCGSPYKGQTCQGSTFGNCCSTYGYCGSTSDYCAPPKCQKDFGSCSGAQVSSVRGTTLSSVIVPANPSLASAVRETVTVTSTLTPPGQRIVTVTLTPSAVPAVTVTSTQSGAAAITVTSTQAAAPAITVISTQTAAVQTVVETLAPLPASTITVVTTAAPLPASTVLQTVVETLAPLPPSTITVVTTAPPLAPVTITSVETLPPLAASTVTVVETAPPLAPLTVTSIETVPPPPASTVVQTVVETLPPLAASTITVVETAPPLAASTVTVIETAPPLAASTITVIETPSPLAESTITETSTISATPLPAVVVTSTLTASAAASCPTGNVVVNGDFEQSLAGNWVALPAGDVTLERTTAAAASGGTSSLRVRISAINGNLPQRVVQAVQLCAGATYQASFQARRTTTVGSISVILYLGTTPIAGGTITSTAFTAAPVLLPFVAPDSTGLLRLEFTFTGGTNGAKEVLVDSVLVTKV